MIFFLCEVSIFIPLNFDVDVERDRNYFPASEQLQDSLLFSLASGGAAGRAGSAARERCPERGFSPHKH